MESQPQPAPKPILTKDLHNIAKTNLSVAREESDRAYLIRVITSPNNSIRMHC